jgi:hypothetical protein
VVPGGTYTLKLEDGRAGQLRIETDYAASVRILHLKPKVLSSDSGESSPGDPPQGAFSYDQSGHRDLGSKLMMRVSGSVGIWGRK